MNEICVSSTVVLWCAPFIDGVAIIKKSSKE